MAKLYVKMPGTMHTLSNAVSIGLFLDCRTRKRDFGTPIHSFTQLQGLISALLYFCIHCLNLEASAIEFKDNLSLIKKNGIKKNNFWNIFQWVIKNSLHFGDYFQWGSIIGVYFSCAVQLPLAFRLMYFSIRWYLENALSLFN